MFNGLILFLDLNKENIVFTDGIGVKGLRFNFHGYHHGNHSNHYGNHRGYHGNHQDIYGNHGSAKEL